MERFDVAMVLVSNLNPCAVLIAFLSMLLQNHDLQMFVALNDIVNY